MKKVISLVIVLSLVTFTMGFTPQVFAQDQDTISQEKISETTQAARESGARAGGAIAEGLTIGQAITATAIIATAAVGAVLLNDTFEGKNSGPAHPGQ